MREITLKDYVEEHSQTAAGAALGMTQGAIWQALRGKRDIYIVVDSCGKVVGSYEKKHIGKRPEQQLRATIGTRLTR
jgi:hypothetical protein